MGEEWRARKRIVWESISRVCIRSEVHNVRYVVLDERYPDTCARPVRLVVVAEESDKMLLFVCVVLVSDCSNNERWSLRAILLLKKYHNIPAYARLHSTFPSTT